MRSQHLSLDSYNTDKIANQYLEYYDPALQHLVDQEVKVLEIGVREGGSVLLWRDYFPNGNITGIDLKLPDGLTGEDRIQLFQGSQDDTAFLTKVAQQTAPGGFDVIIDDASHVGTLTKVAFWHLFEKHLKPSGLYVIEDWGTGYWDDWPDGQTVRAEPPSRSVLQKLLQRLNPTPELPFPNHSHGMVGFIKELVDEQGAADVTRARMTGTAVRLSKFEKMLITPSIVFITKRAS